MTTYDDTGAAWDTASMFRTLGLPERPTSDDIEARWNSPSPVDFVLGAAFTGHEIAPRRIARVDNGGNRVPITSRLFSMAITDPPETEMHPARHVADGMAASLVLRHGPEKLTVVVASPGGNDSLYPATPPHLLRMGFDEGSPGNLATALHAEIDMRIDLSWHHNKVSFTRDLPISERITPLIVFIDAFPWGANHSRELHRAAERVFQLGRAAGIYLVMSATGGPPPEEWIPGYRRFNLPGTMLRLFGGQPRGNMKLGATFSPTHMDTQLLCFDYDPAELWRAVSQAPGGGRAPRISPAWTRLGAR